MKKFWNWVIKAATETEPESRTLYLYGPIADESWWGDEVTPAAFREELEAGTGNIEVWINSPGGDCFAAAQIYNMLREYNGKVTVKIDGIAASAASVIAMAGDVVSASPVSMMMIHNPATIAMGDHNEMQKTIDILNEVKESIINAYQDKTRLSRNKLSRLMEDETWMNAKKMVELGFADEIMFTDNGEQADVAATMFGKKPYAQAIVNKLNMSTAATEPEPEPDGVDAKVYYDRLNDIKNKF